MAVRQQTLTGEVGLGRLPVDALDGELPIVADDRAGVSRRLRRVRRAELLRRGRGSRLVHRWQWHVAGGLRGQRDRRYGGGDRRYGVGARPVVRGGRRFDVRGSGGRELTVVGSTDLHGHSGLALLRWCYGRCVGGPEGIEVEGNAPHGEFTERGVEGVGTRPGRPVEGHGRVLTAAEDLPDQARERGPRADLHEGPHPRRVHRLDLVLEEDRRGEMSGDPAAHRVGAGG